MVTISLFPKKWLHACVYHHRIKPKVGRNFTSERGEGVKVEVKNISLHWLQGIFETVPYYMMKHAGGSKLQKTKANILTHTGGKVPVKGKYPLMCEHRSIRCVDSFIVTDMKTEPVLSLNACIKMNLIKRVDSVNSQMQTSQSVSTSVLDEFPQPVVNAPRYL